MKTYTLYFEGQVEVEAETDEEATDRLMQMMTAENVGHYRIMESDPDRIDGIRLVEEF